MAVPDERPVTMENFSSPSLTFLKGGQSLAVHLSNDEAVKLGAALFQIVAERGGRKRANDRPSVSLGIMVMAWQHYFDKFHGTRQQMKEGALRFCEAERR